jgi:hypothetical protein
MLDQADDRLGPSLGILNRQVEAIRVEEKSQRRLRSMTASIGSHNGSFGKGSKDLGKPRNELAAQRRVVYLALHRARPQDFLFVGALLCGWRSGVLVGFDRIHDIKSCSLRAMC